MIEQTGFLLPIASWVLFSSLKSIAIIPLVLLIRRVFTKWLTPQARYGLWFALIACLTIPFGAQVDLRGTPRATEVPVPVHAASRANAANYEKPVIGISTAAVTSSFQPSPRTVAILVWVLGVAVLAAAVLRNAARYSRMSFTASEPDAATTRLFEHCTQIVKIRRHVRLLETSGVDSPLLVGYWRPALLLPRNLSSHINREQLRMVLLHELTHVGRHDILVNWLITCVQIAHWFNPLAWYALRIARNDMEQACDAGVLRHLTTAEQLEYGNTLIRLSDMTPRQALLVQNASVVESRSQLKERISMIARFKPLGTASSILGATLIALTSIVACTQGADAPQQPAKPAVQLATAAVVEQAAAVAGNAVSQEPKAEAGPETSKPMPDTVKQQEAGSAPALEAAYLKINYASAKDLAALMKSPPGLDLLSARGSIAIDERTNTLLIHDTPQNLPALRELVARLDVQVDQVFIESVFAMVDDDLIREITGLAPPGGTGALGTLDFGLDRSAITALEAGVNANRAEVIFMPRFTVASRSQASIEQSTPPCCAPGQPANLRLKFSPIVRPDKRIRLGIGADISLIGTVLVVDGQRVPTINTKKVDAEILLDSGGTAMLDLRLRDWRSAAPEEATSKRRLVAFITVRSLPTIVASSK